MYITPTINRKLKYFLTRLLTSQIEHHMYVYNITSKCLLIFLLGKGNKIFLI